MSTFNEARNEFSFDGSSRDGESRSKSTTPKNLLRHNGGENTLRSASSDTQNKEDGNSYPPMCNNCVMEISKLNHVMESQQKCTERLQQDISQLNATISNLTTAITKLITVMEKDQFDFTSLSSNSIHPMESSAANTKPNSMSSLSISAQEDKNSHQDIQYSNEEAVQFGPVSQEKGGKLELAVGSSLAIMPFAASGSSSPRVS